MDKQSAQPHKETGFWQRVRPQDTAGWLYLLGAFVLIVLILGGICLYLPAMFMGNDPDSTTLLVRAGGMMSFP